MLDEELVALAAKAAGVELNPDWDMDEQYWQPLTDDGDALRLAVKLHLDINSYPRSSEVAAVQHRQNIGVYARSIERINDDPYAATRRAIVRAAAEIGKAIRG